MGIAPETYRSAGPASSAVPNCYWARLRDLDGDLDSTIANHNPSGPTIVTVATTDKAIEVTGCQTFRRT